MITDKSEDALVSDVSPGLSRARTILLEVAGAILLAIGAVGVFLPLIPTTPFVILAAFCFAGNPVIYGKIQNSPFFGDYLRAWKEKRTIPMSARIQGIVMVWIVLLISMLFFMKEDWQRILFIIVGLCVSIHILTIFRKV